MKKLLLSLLLCATLLAMLTGPVAAIGAVHIPYTGNENMAYCSDPTITDARCGLMSPGATKLLPNGKGITQNTVLVIEFASSNPLINGVTIATFMVKPGSDTVTPVDGTWHLEPFAYDGYWEGQVNISMTPTGYRSVFSGKGYGALAGMIIKGTNESGFLSGEIIDLP